VNAKSHNFDEKKKHLSLSCQSINWTRFEQAWLLGAVD
jgi:hypothetical protein